MRVGQLLFIHREAAGTQGLALALLAGFVASVAMLMAFAVAFTTALILSNAPVPVLADWFRGLTSNHLIDAAGPNLYAATAVYFTGGLLWALLYGLVFEARLHGPGWQRGMTFSLVPWLCSLLIFMPLVGGGLFGASLGAGPLPIVGNLILHLVYGAVLGTVWTSAESVIDRPLNAAWAEDLQAGRLSESAAARGLGIGIAVGIVLGILATVATPAAAGLGLNPLAMVVSVALTGAAFGAFIGSLSTS